MSGFKKIRVMATIYQRRNKTNDIVEQTIDVGANVPDWVVKKLREWNE